MKWNNKTYIVCRFRGNGFRWYMNRKKCFKNLINTFLWSELKAEKTEKYSSSVFSEIFPVTQPKFVLYSENLTNNTLMWQ